MPFIIPNTDQATYGYQAEPDRGDIDALVAGIGGGGVVSGCAVTAQGTPNMTVAVAGGTVNSTPGAGRNITAGNVTIAAANATNPRIDLVVATSGGTLAARQGTAAIAPEYPSLTAGDVLLAAVAVPANATSITSTMIVDKRVILPPAKTPVEVALTAYTPWTTQAGFPILSGTFTPKGTSGTLLILGSGINAGQALGDFDLWYGQVSFPLYQAASNNGGLVPVAGVTTVQVGKLGAQLAATFGRECVVTGLTPGVAVNWTAILGIAAGSITLNTGGAYRVAITPDRTKAYITDYWLNRVVVVNLLGGTQGYYNRPPTPGSILVNLDAVKCLVNVGTNPLELAVTPDGTKVITANYGGTVTVINTATETVQGTYTMPGTTPHPYSVVCPNNTTAYVCDNANAVVYPVTIATGVFGTAIAVGVNPTWMCSTPNGAEIYVPNTGSGAANTVSVIATATNTVTNTISLGASGTVGPTACAAMPNGTAVWVAVVGNAANGGQRLYQILTATHTVGVVSDPYTANSSQINALVVDPQGLTVQAVDNTGTWIQYWAATPAPQGGGGGAYAGKIFTAAQILPTHNLTGIAVDSVGSIYIADFTGNQLFEWPSSLIEIDPTNGFVDDYLSVVWKDA